MGGKVNRGWHEGGKWMEIRILLSYHLKMLLLVYRICEFCRLENFPSSLDVTYSATLLTFPLHVLYFVGHIVPMDRSSFFLLFCPQPLSSWPFFHDTFAISFSHECQPSLQGTGNLLQGCSSFSYKILNTNSLSELGIRFSHNLKLSFI